MNSGATKENESLKKACITALETYTKIKEEKFNASFSRLEWCVGSYDFDKNPSGLLESAVTTLEELKAYKEENPRKVTKQIIEKLEKAISKLQPA